MLTRDAAQSSGLINLVLQADVCKLLPAVPRSMSACVRELFQRMAALDPQLRTQLAEWLAYHLSNFDFMWPWAKWTYVLQAAAHDAQRWPPVAMEAQQGPHTNTWTVQAEFLASHALGTSAHSPMRLLWWSKLASQPLSRQERCVMQAFCG